MPESIICPIPPSPAKVLVTGAFPTGKTTLCRQLKSLLEQNEIAVALVSEVPRRCPLPLNRDQTPLASAWLIGEQIRAEAEAATIGTPDVVVCDRGLPDIISHTFVLREDNPNWAAAIDLLVEMSVSWCRTYTAVWWARAAPCLPIEADGVRLADKDFQRTPESSLKLALGMLGIAHQELPSQTNARVSLIADRIRSLVRR
ncbi:MAG: AAA family ATPase [Phycisphaerales bacterium]|nr:AAA family ATPase [Phycisphaerales bacterium]